MSDRATVKAQSLTFGTSGTFTSLPDGTGALRGTSTSNPIALPRDDYTIQLTALSTGTSIVGATVVWQTSNDSVAWVPQGSATALSTNASTASSVGAAGFAITSKYAYGRGVLTSTGTGSAQAFMGS